MRTRYTCTQLDWLAATTGRQIGLLLSLIAVMSWVFVPNAVSAQVESQYPATRFAGAMQSPPGAFPAARAATASMGNPNIAPATRAAGQAASYATCFDPPLGRCFQGQELNLASYGASAYVDTVDPYIIPYNGGNDPPASDEFVMTMADASEYVFMQIGWSKQPVCGMGKQPYVFPEYHSRPIGTEKDDPEYYHNFCWMPLSSGKHKYYQYQSDGTAATGFWCNSFDSNVSVQCVGNGDLQNMTHGTLVAFYGESSHPSNQMGGPTESSAVYFSNVCVNTKTSATSPSTADIPCNPDFRGITSQPHGTCVTPCPYDSRFTLDSNSGAVSLWNWTK